MPLAKNAMPHAFWPERADPYQFLEELDSAASVDWVDAQNARTHDARWLDDARYRALVDRFTQALLPRERPVIPRRWQDWAYDVWQDEQHPKGLWRRTRWADWRSGQADWQTLIDLDALGEAQGVQWVFDDQLILEPDGDRALIVLSDGGADAVVIREFDIAQCRFVDDGFSIEAAGKHSVEWIDRDTIYVGWDNGGATVTRSGYPREVRRWTRGTPLSGAPVVFRGARGDIFIDAQYDPVDRHHAIEQAINFYDANTYRLADDGAWTRYDVPPHVEVGYWNGWLLLQPRLDWTCDGARYAGGSLLAIREDAFIAGGRTFSTLFEPNDRTSACGWTHTRRYVLVSWLDDVLTRTMLWCPEHQDDGAWRWHARPFPARGFAQVDVSPVEPTFDDEVYVSVDDYLTPPEYSLANLDDDLSAWTLLDRWPTQFDASTLAVRRDHARSRDGTLVPYTLVGPRDVLDDAARTPRPCLLNGYGGFAIALTPDYDPLLGIGWLEKGGIAVFAHIRGGGEFGTQWHESVRQTERQRSFDDFIAVAEKLVADGVTTAAQLGIRGGSNGGLLVAACMIQRPELFGAVVSDVPLLDMQRYPLLHAGASWLDEFGDPDDPAHAPALAAYSPYHRVASDVAYPPALFTTSTSDDRVHPAHARKMVARMQAQGHRNVWLLEKTDGGHGSADAIDTAEHEAIGYAFLWSHLSRDANDARE
ncbi:S9 family peptidase [Burkholderia thailandensis]|nr:S9 family peptidase [Burkholderia thailandensis]